MTIDPYSAAVLKRMAAVYPDVGGTVRDAALARRLHARAGFPAGPSVPAVKDVQAGDVPARIYWPSDPALLDGDPLPVVVYFHGGGWVLCDLDTHDGVCRLLAADAGVIVVSVDYRRAPEHRYPAAADDAYAALCWAHRFAGEFGGDPSRLVVAGDSAGGNLAAVTCLRARDLGGPALTGQLLIYPVTDCLAARSDRAEGYLLRSSHMTWFTRQYLASPAQALEAYASPLRAPSLTGLPPAMVLTVGYDPLCPEGLAYADRLVRSGVPVATHHAEGLFHGVFGLGRLLPLARTTEDAACAWLREITKDGGNPDPDPLGRGCQVAIVRPDHPRDGTDMNTTEADISAALGKLMGQVLVREPLDGDDDFFDSGGDSVRAIEVLQLLIEQRRMMDASISDDMQAVLLEAFFEDASPNALAAVYMKHLESAKAGQEAS